MFPMSSPMSEFDPESLNPNLNKPHQMPNIRNERQTKCTASSFSSAHSAYSCGFSPLGILGPRVGPCALFLGFRFPDI